MSNWWEAESEGVAVLMRSEREQAKRNAAMSFAERHPYVVRDETGAYDSRWTNYQAALDHASLIGGYVDAPVWHEDAL